MQCNKAIGRRRIRRTVGSATRQTACGERKQEDDEHMDLDFGNGCGGPANEIRDERERVTITNTFNKRRLTPQKWKNSRMCKPSAKEQNKTCVFTHPKTLYEEHTGTHER